MRRKATPATTKKQQNMERLQKAHKHRIHTPNPIDYRDMNKTQQRLYIRALTNTLPNMKTRLQWYYKKNPPEPREKGIIACSNKECTEKKPPAPDTLEHAIECPGNKHDVTRIHRAIEQIYNKTKTHIDTTELQQHTQMILQMLIPEKLHQQRKEAKETDTWETELIKRALHIQEQ